MNKSAAYKTVILFVGGDGRRIKYQIAGHPFIVECCKRDDRRNYDNDQRNRKHYCVFDKDRSNASNLTMVVFFVA
jgi:hypothetical protein